MKPAPAKRRPVLTASAGLAFLVVCCVTGVQAQLDLKTRDSQMSLFNDVLAGLLSTMEFFGSSYKEVNVDAMICMRLCQGSLVGILEDCGLSGHLCPKKVTQEIQAIIDKLNNIVDITFPYVEEQNKEATTAFVDLLTEPFVVRLVPEHLRNFTEKSRIFNEYDGDQGNLCIINLLGTDTSGKAVPRCTVSDNCWWFMTRENSGRYYITHQLLYTMISERVGCEGELEQRLLRQRGISLRDFQRYLCEQIYSNALFLFKNRSVPNTYQDLFMEEIAFCGMLGFQNFWNQSWIPMILGWQTVSGCFTDIILPDGTGQHAPWGMYEIDTQFQDIQELIDNSKHVSRRTEKLMHDGCLSHKTGVAISAMGTFMRHLVSELYIKV